MESLASLGLPALIAAIGYVSKLLIEALVDRQRRKRQALTERLSLFCYPILTRLQENAPIWPLIVAGQDEEVPRGEVVAAYVQEQVLKNHEEIMEIVCTQRHRMPFDAELDEQLQAYIQHVVFYRALAHAGVDAFPGQLGVPYPRALDEVLEARTRKLQRELDRTWW